MAVLSSDNLYTVTIQPEYTLYEVIDQLRPFHHINGTDKKNVDNNFRVGGNGMAVQLSSAYMSHSI